MSEEILNETQETAALFVAKQRKKEEDQKAAEEQAQRELKAAEVRRMEAEIEQQKKKAKRGRLIAIGVGAGAVIITLIIIVSVLDAASTAGMVDYAGFAFDAEYTPSSASNKISIKYPGDFYTEVSENLESENKVFLEFTPEKDTEVFTRVSIGGITRNHSEAFTEADIAYTDPDDYAAMMKSRVEEELKILVPGAVISDESVPDVRAQTPEKYCYTCNFTTKEKSGGALCWIEIAEDGVINLVSMLCMKPGEALDDGATLRDGFAAANTENALMVVGGNPPAADAALDGILDYSRIDLKIKAPKNLFYLTEESEKGGIMFGDKNGAGILIIPIEYKTGFDNMDVTIEQVIQYYQGFADSGIEPLLSGISNRQEISTTYMQTVEDDFYRTYQFEKNGRTYYEIFYMVPYRDTTNGVDYFLMMEFFAPSVNKFEYDSIFMNIIRAMTQQ